MAENKFVHLYYGSHNFAQAISPWDMITQIQNENADMPATRINIRREVIGAAAAIPFLMQIWGDWFPARQSLNQVPYNSR